MQEVWLPRHVHAMPEPHGEESQKHTHACWVLTVAVASSEIPDMKGGISDGEASHVFALVLQMHWCPGLMVYFRKLAL